MKFKVGDIIVETSCKEKFIFQIESINPNVIKILMLGNHKRRKKGEIVRSEFEEKEIDSHNFEIAQFKGWFDEEIIRKKFNEIPSKPL